MTTSTPYPNPLTACEVTERLSAMGALDCRVRTMEGPERVVLVQAPDVATVDRWAELLGVTATRTSPVPGQGRSPFYGTYLRPHPALPGWLVDVYCVVTVAEYARLVLAA